MKNSENLNIYFKIPVTYDKKVGPKIDFFKADLESWDHRDSKNINIFFTPFALSETSQEVTVAPKSGILSWVIEDVSVTFYILKWLIINLDRKLKLF